MNRCIVLLVMSLTAAAQALRLPVIPNGTYRCTTGDGPLKLSLGEAVIAGNRYTVTDRQHHVTGGTYGSNRTGYSWSGDFGAVKHAELADSSPAPGGFDVRYALGRTSPVSIACRRF